MAATPIRFREATLIGADGVVGSAETFAGLVLGLRLTGLALRAAHPPLLREEGNTSRPDQGSQQWFTNLRENRFPGNAESIVLIHFCHTAMEFLCLGHR